jgi:hypothetical protein
MLPSEAICCFHVVIIPVGQLTLDMGQKPQGKEALIYD